MTLSSVLDCTVQPEAAGALALRVVDARDRVRAGHWTEDRVRQRLQVLRLECRCVAALIVEDGSICEERRAAVRAAIGGGVAGADGIRLLHRHPGSVHGCAGEGGEN